MNKQALTQLFNLKTDVFTNHSPIKKYKQKLQTYKKKVCSTKNENKIPLISHKVCVLTLVFIIFRECC